MHECDDSGNDSECVMRHAVNVYSRFFLAACSETQIQLVMNRVKIRVRLRERVVDLTLTIPDNASCPNIEHCSSLQPDASPCSNWN
jgi:hypothetical protein